MRMKREKEDEEEDKKVVVPPVDRNLLPAADRKALLQDGGAQGRRKALRLHAASHAPNGQGEDEQRAQSQSPPSLLAPRGFYRAPRV